MGLGGWVARSLAPLREKQVVGGMGPQPVINMVTGEGFINFDSEEGVNLSVGTRVRTDRTASFSVRYTPPAPAAVAPP